MIIYKADGTQLVSINATDSSVRSREIGGDHTLTLYYSLAEHVEIPVGSYCIYEGMTYTLEEPEAFTMDHSRKFNYTVVFQSAQYKLQRFKFRDVVYAASTGVFGGTHKLKFNLTAKPIDHLQMIVDNLNERDSGWSIGDCIDDDEKYLSYNHVFCIDALKQLADEYKTEWEVNGKVISLHKVEYNKTSPLDLNYGKGNGLKGGIQRENYTEKNPCEVLFPEGGEQNIDSSTYGSDVLLLPKSQTIKYDGIKFEGEDGYVEANAREYVTDEYGYSIRRANKTLTTKAEDSIDCTDLYPKRVGTVSQVICESEANNYYDIVDTTIPDALDFSKCLIAGEQMTIIFQSGMLAGKEFDVSYIAAAVGDLPGKRFAIVPQKIDGLTMPGGDFIPRVDDKYAIFHCSLPSAYICDNTSKSGASWDMFRKAVKYLYEREDQHFTVSGTLNGIWAKNDWINIGAKIKIGGFVRFTDPRFQADAILIRITAIKDFVNKAHKPEITLSNSTTGGDVKTTLGKIKNNEVTTSSLHRQSLQFTMRRYADTVATAAALKKALLHEFTDAISPVVVNAMQLKVGSQALQFQFITSLTDSTVLSHSFTYDSASKTLSTAAGYILHNTLDINSIKPSHDITDYLRWSVSEFTSLPFTDADKDKAFYLYIKASKSATTAEFYLSDTAIELEGISGYYCLLCGILNPESEGTRSFAPMYGFTEILPGQIVTDIIRSTDGKTYFDLANSEIGGNIKFIATDGTTKNVANVDASTAENKAKLAGLTVIDGGLVATIMIKLGNGTTDGNTAGVSGINKVTSGAAPAFWAGGTYEQALKILSDFIHASNICFTHDGEGKIGQTFIDAAGVQNLRDATGANRLIMSANLISTLSQIIGNNQSTSANTNGEVESVENGTKENSSAPVALGSISVTCDNATLTMNIPVSTYVDTDKLPGRGRSYVNLFLKNGDTVINIGGVESIYDQDSGDSVSNNRTFAPKITVNTGTYTLYAEYNILSSRQEIISHFNIGSGTLSWSYDVSNDHSEAGRNGFLTYVDKNNYLFTAKDSRMGAATYGKFLCDGRGVFHLPGVLAAGRVNGSSIADSWGEFSCSVSHSVDGTYTITHNIGHTNYFVLLTPCVNSNSKHDLNAVVSTKAANTFSVLTSYSDSQSLVDCPFEFVIIGARPTIS